MILAIDVGNTNIVLGCINKGEILNIVRIQTDPGQTAAEWAVKLKQLLEFYNVDCRGIEGAIISSVVPQITGALREAIELISGVRALVVGPGMKTGMNIRLDDPSTLAGDLVAGSVAAMSYYGTPAIVIDMGTATTMVVVDKNKSYLGGAIIPGVNLAYGALASGTSLLPDIAIRPPKKVIASNTVDSMRSGAVFGTAALLDGMIDKMEAELGEKCSLVATGGLARSIVECCSHKIVYDDDLLLKGLWVLYEKNK